MLSMATPAMPTSPADAGMIGIVAAVGGQIESDAEAHLAGGQISAVKGIGIFRGRKACILPDRPRPLDVHGGVGTAQKRRNAGHGVRDDRRPVKSAAVYSGLTGMSSGVCHAGDFQLSVAVAVRRGTRLIGHSAVGPEVRFQNNLEWSAINQLCLPRLPFRARLLRAAFHAVWPKRRT